jgi:hypothetical protein
MKAITFQLNNQPNTYNMSTGTTSMVWALSVLLPVLASNLVDPALGVPASAVDNEVNNQTSKMQLAAYFQLYTYEGNVLKPSIEFTQYHLRDISPGRLIITSSGNVTLSATVYSEDLGESTEVLIGCRVNVPRIASDMPIAWPSFFYVVNKDFRGHMFGEDKFPYYKLLVNLYPVIKLK